jgi:putative nucleotidyltransferase with HDIG domain
MDNNRVIAEQEKIIAEHEKTIAEHKKIIAKHEKTIAQQKQTIAEQKQTIAEQVRTIVNHKNAIKVKDAIYVEAETTLRALLDLLTDLIELRDPYTEGHSLRVAEMSVALAEQEAANFPQDEITALKYGALLHDIGKIAISDFVLNKPTLITRLEKQMIQQHVAVGYELIKNLEFDPLIGDVIQYHHENYDGSGYCEGLRGEAIPLAARIVRIADVYDALTSKRPYRRAYSSEEAIEVMRETRHQFDPLLLDIFLQMVDSK